MLNLLSLYQRIHHTSEKTPITRLSHLTELMCTTNTHLQLNSKSVHIMIRHDMTEDIFRLKPGFLLRPHWSCLVLKGPFTLQGKSSGTAKGPFNVVSTLHVKYRTTATPLLTYKIRLPCTLQLNASNWSVADWKALKQTDDVEGAHVAGRPAQLAEVMDIWLYLRK